MRSMTALQLMDVQVNVIFIAAFCRRAEKERKPRQRAAGGRRGRSISMSAHRLNATESDGQQMAPGEHRIAGSLLCRTCSQVAEQYRFHALSDVYAAEAGRARKFGDGRSCPGPETQKMESATAALLKFAALTRMRETTKTIRLAATRSA